MSNTIVSVDELQLDNTIKFIAATETEPEHYGSDNGIVKSDFYSDGNRVVYTFRGREFIWEPSDMRYMDELGTEDVIYSVTDVPLEAKANYARFNRSMPDIDDWFIQENRRLKHQILVQGFQRDPMFYLFGKIDFVIGGTIKFDADLKVVADGAEQTNAFETTGGIDFVDAEGTVLFHMPEVVSFDSKTPDRARETGKYRASFDGSGVLAFQIVMDNEWIASTERVYPLVIDPTIVVSAGYNTQTNGSRKISRLSNGWLVSAVTETGTPIVYFYKSTDNGATWTQLCWFSGRSASIVSNGTTVYAVAWHGASTDLCSWKFDAATQTNVEITNTNRVLIETVSTISSFGISLAISTNGNLHAAYASGINSISNGMFNIRYSKSADGGVTWSSPVALTAGSTSTTESRNLSVSVRSDGNPIVLYGVEVSTSFNVKIGASYFNGSSWQSSTVYSTTTNMDFPSIVVKKNGSNVGRIWAAWQGTDATDTVFNIRVAYSDDSGATWSAMTKITTGNTIARKQPTLAEHFNGDVYVFYSEDEEIRYQKCANGSTAFSGATILASSSLADPYPNAEVETVNGFIGVLYMDSSSVKFEKLLLNSIPTAPSGLTPTGGTIRDRATVIRLAWTHNDTTGDGQSKFDLQYRVQGSGTWTTYSNTTPNNYYDAPALTFGNNFYEWQVRTYDQQAAVSPYSAVSVFKASNKTPAPTITFPIHDGSVTIANPTVTWSSVGQVQYELKLLDASGTTTLFTDTQTSGSTAKTITYNLVSDSAYKLTLRVMDAGGIWSDLTEISFDTDFAEPATPTIALSKDDVRGSVAVTFESAVPSGGIPTVATNEVYRRENASDWVRLTASAAFNVSPNELPPFSQWTLHENTRMRRANFVGKISGSATANPNSAYARTSSAFGTPPFVSGVSEFNSTEYTQLSALDGSLKVTVTATNLAIAQHLFSFDLIEHTIRKWGAGVFGTAVTTAERVAWLKANLSKLNFNWHGFGSGPAGNKATIASWSTTWVTGSNTTASVPTKLAFTISTISSFVQSDGYVHLLAYADASNGTTASTINTDFIELEVYYAAGSVPIADYDLTLEATAAWQISTFEMSVNVGEVYTISGTVAGIGGFYWVKGIRESGVFYDLASSVTTQYTFTIPSDTVRIQVQITNNAAGTFTFTNPQLELGNVATLFSPKGGYAVYAGNKHRGTYTDYTPKPLADVEYYINSIGSNGTYAASSTAGITPNVAHTQISSLLDTGKYATLHKGARLQQKNTVDSSKMKFAGRDYPLVEFGDGKESVFDFKYLVFTWDELQVMEELAESGETLLLRDSSGRKAYVALGGMSVTENPTYWEISVQPEKVYYVEGV